MSMRFNSVATLPYIGAVQPAATALCTPPTQKPYSVPLLIDWNVYWQALNQPSSVGVSIDLSLLSPAGGALSEIRSAKIDNTFSNNPIYIVFSDTQDVVTCPPQTVVTMPVNTNQQNFTIIAQDLRDGYIPLTRIWLYNIMLPASVDPAIQYNYPRYLGSPTIQRNFNQTLTPGYGSPALGDQTKNYNMDMGTALNSVTLWNSPVAAGGYLYITTLYLQLVNCNSPANKTIELVIDGSVSGNLYDIPVSFVSGYPAANPPIVLLALMGLQIKLSASETWKLKALAGNTIANCTAQLFTCWTYNPL